MISSVTYREHRLVIRQDGSDWIVAIFGPFAAIIRRPNRSLALGDARTHIDLSLMRPPIVERARARSTGR